MRSASATARMPEAQTLLIVSEPMCSGHADAERDLARRDVAGAGLHDLADHGVVDVARLDLGALQRGRGRDDAELHRRARRERAAQTAEGRARGGEDHGVGTAAGYRARRDRDAA